MGNGHAVSKAEALAEHFVRDVGTTGNLRFVGRIHEARNRSLDFVAVLVFGVFVTGHHLGLETVTDIGLEDFRHVEVDHGFPEEPVGALALAEAFDPSLTEVEVDQVTPVGDLPLALHVGIIRHQPGVVGGSVLLPVVEVVEVILDSGNYVGCPVLREGPFEHATFSHCGSGKCTSGYARHE